MNQDQTKKVVSGYAYYLRDKIGRGASSQVFRGICQKTLQPVAIKVISISQDKKQSQISMSSSEIDLLRKLKQSPNIIQLKVAIQTKNNIYIVTQLCEEGNLQTQLTKMKRFDQETAVNIMKQIIKGYAQIAKKGIIHRDLKPSNIVKTGQTYKIADFGYGIEAKFTQKPTVENVGSPLYMPLQSLEENLYSFKSDIWAIGVIFVQLLNGKIPWKARTQKQLILELKNFQLNSVIPKFITEVSKQFLQKIFNREVQKRMTIQELMQWNFKNGLINNCIQCESSLKLRNLLQKPLNLKSTINLLNSKEGQGNKNFKSVSNILTLKNTSLDKTQVSNVKPNQSKQSISPDKTAENNLSISNITFSQTKPLQSMVLPFELFKYKQDKRIESQALLSINLNYSLPISSGNLLNKMRSTSFFEDSQTLIFSQIQAQINYFRFIFKVLKKLNDCLKTKHQKILQLKNALLANIYQKIVQVSELKYIKGISNKQKESFISSKHFEQIETILLKYRQRCRQVSNTFGLKLSLKSEREFLKIISYVMNLIYLNIIEMKQNQQMLNRKKSLVFILQDLITLSSLFLQQKQQHWLNFRNNSNIDAYLAKITPKQITQAYFKAVETKFMGMSQF